MAKFDYSPFQFTKYYSHGNVSITFDFNLRELTGHNRSVFPEHRSLVYFLENNPGKKIYITQTGVEDFHEDGDNLVVNLGKYQEFCKCIGQNGQNRAHAFFTRRTHHYSDEEKRQILAASSEADILDWIRNLSEDKKEEFCEKMAAIDGVDLQEDQLTDEKFSTVLANALNEPHKLHAISDLYPRVKLSLLETYRDFLENTLKKIAEDDSPTDSWETYIQNWIDGKIDHEGKPLEGIDEKESKSRCLIFGLEFFDHKREVLDSGQRMDVLTRISTSENCREYVLIELKSPKAEILVERDGGLSISPKLSRAIPQVIDYKADFEMKDDGDSDLARSSLNAGKIVKCIILVGVTKEDAKWKKVLSGLKSNFSNLIEIWTYSDLLERLTTTIKNLKETL